MASINFNLPLMSIPAYYLLAIWPHNSAIMISTRGNMKQHDNRNHTSSENKEKLRKRLTASEFAAYERAQSCHRNNLENMPLFCAAIFAGLLAEQKVGKGGAGLKTFTIGWMVIRALYTISYLKTETVQWSYLRSALYGIGTFWAFGVIGKAAYVLGP